MVLHQRGDRPAHPGNQGRRAPRHRRRHHQLPHPGAVAAKYGEIKACSGNTSIFLYPGVQFHCIDGLITNFHLPESTLIMLVSALYGYEKTMAAYKVAVEQKYRFFSFGDAMLIV